MCVFPLTSADVSRFQTYTYRQYTHAVHLNDFVRCKTAVTLTRSYASVTQDSPPKPRDRAISIQESSKTTVYVSEFGGIASEQTVLEQAAKLAADLKDAGTEINKDLFYFASYDPPYRCGHFRFRNCLLLFRNCGS